MFIHPQAAVSSDNIGERTRVWQFAVIAKGAVVGTDCNINCHSFIEGGVCIGNHVTLKSGVYLWNGITVEDHVFIGPNASFTNDLYPRSGQHILPVTTLICKGASIGANATLLAGITIGRYAMVGAGSVVTKSVPSYALVYGNPAEIKGWVDELGQKLKQESDTIFVSMHGDRYQRTESGLCKL